MKRVWVAAAFFSAGSAPVDAGERIQACSSPSETERYAQTYGSDDLSVRGDWYDKTYGIAATDCEPKPLPVPPGLKAVLEVSLPPPSDHPVDPGTVRIETGSVSKRAPPTGSADVTAR